MSAQASVSSKPRRLSAPGIAARKGGEKLVCLTAYSTPVARVLDAHVDVLLVGDSVGMVLYGMDSTLPVTLEIMAQHAAAVVRGSESAAVVVDLPFGSYQRSPQDAFDAAARLMTFSGATAVKLEGGVAMAETIAFLVARGIPVMGHIGLMPQYVSTMGGYKVQGRDDASRTQLLADAQAITDAGAFAVVLEGITEPVAREITASVVIPTIGIGASPACDGQVLVTEDMAGLSEHTPKFVRQFGDMGTALEKAGKAYAAAVREGSFPAEDECY